MCYQIVISFEDGICESGHIFTDKTVVDGVANTLREAYKLAGLPINVHIKTLELKQGV